jgi:hypothetical protein
VWHYGWQPVLDDENPTRLLRQKVSGRITDMGSLSHHTLLSAALGVACILVQIPNNPAHAQLLNQLKGATGSSQSSGMLGVLGGSALPSVTQASPSNTAGVLQYCVKNNYVNGSSASSVKDSLMSKVTGSGHGTNDSGYQSGSKGVLDTGNGQGFSLGGGGIKAQVTQKVCDQVLQHAKSML